MSKRIKKDDNTYLPLVATTASEIEPAIRSWLKWDENMQLPSIPIAARPALQEQCKGALWYHATKPGGCLNPLTEEDRKELTPIERQLYNLVLEAQSPDGDWAKQRYVLDQILGPVVQKSESLTVKGSPEDWLEAHDEVYKRVQATMQEAEEIEDAVDAS